MKTETSKYPMARKSEISAMLAGKKVIDPVWWDDRTIKLELIRVLAGVHSMKDFRRLSKSDAVDSPKIGCCP